jgi:hypothetical protein
MKCDWWLLFSDVNITNASYVTFKLISNIVVDAEDKGRSLHR